MKLQLARLNLRDSTYIEAVKTEIVSVKLAGFLALARPGADFIICFATRLWLWKNLTEKSRQLRSRKKSSKLGWLRFFSLCICF